MEKFLIVSTKVVPDCFEKVIEARNLLTSQEVDGVSEACNKVGISRSTFYKYKDMVYSFSDKMNGRKAELNFLLYHKEGVLSEVLRMLSSHNANILSIYQAVPINNIASLSIQIDISNMTNSPEDMLKPLSDIFGVKKVLLVSME